MPDQLTTNSQPARAISGLHIYLCAVFMLFPTLLGGIFCMTVLMPKLRAFQHTIEALPDERSQVPSLWNGISENIGIGLQIALGILVIVFVFLELRVAAWKRVRHLFVLGSASLVNFVFVAFVLWVAVTASITGPLAGVKSAMKRQSGTSQK